MSETTPLIKAALNLRVGAGFDVYYKNIGQTICKYRKLRGLTQEQLADRACISISYLTKIEAPNCDQPFSLEVILDIAEVLEVSVHQLLEAIK